MWKKVSEERLNLEEEEKEDTSRKAAFDLSVYQIGVGLAAYPIGAIHQANNLTQRFTDLSRHHRCGWKASKASTAVCFPPLPVVPNRRTVRRFILTYSFFIFIYAMTLLVRDISYSGKIFYCSWRVSKVSRHLYFITNTSQQLPSATGRHAWMMFLWWREKNEHGRCWPNGNWRVTWVVGRCASWVEIEISQHEAAKADRGA